MWKRWRHRISEKSRALGVLRANAGGCVDDSGRHEAISRFAAELASRLDGPIGALDGVCPSAGNLVTRDLRAVQELLLELGAHPRARREPMDLASAIADRRAELEERLGGLRLELELDCRGSVVLEPDGLDCLLLPLVDNARDAFGALAGRNGKRSPGVVRIELARRHLPPDPDPDRPITGPSEMIGLAVRDRAGGMAPAVRARAFDPFFSTRGPHRAGLGLPRVLGAARRHGGGVRLDSREGRGTTVEVLLPLADDRAEPPIRSLH
jgi:signal transduction histidine kinase